MQKRVCILIGLTMTASIQAATFTLNPSADAFVTDANVNTNYGAAGALGIAATGSPKGEFRSFIKFDLSAAKTSFDTQYGAGNWTLQSSSLKLTSTAPNNSIFNSTAAGLFNINWITTDSWIEGNGTPAAGNTILNAIVWSDPLVSSTTGDELIGTSLSYSGGTTGATVYSLNASTGFINDLSSGSLLSLKLTPADTSIGYLFNSVNNGTVANRPLLTLVAIPEPTLLSLLGIGAVSLLIRRRAV